MYKGRGSIVSTHTGECHTGTHVPIKWQVVALLALIAFLIASGCTGMGKDPVVGTWEWSDGQGYSELYRFDEDRSFHAGALGSEFAGTWEPVEPGLYLIRYGNVNATLDSTVRAETVVYDERTDAVYFPAHRRVMQGEGVYLRTNREDGR